MPTDTPAKPAPARMAYTVKQAAEQLGFKSINPVYALIRSGDLKAIRIPALTGDLRITARELEDYLGRLEGKRRKVG